MKLIECVPNFSEGQNQETIEAIAESIRSVQHVSLLNVDPGADANRTVYTFIGTPEAVIEAAFNAIQTASEKINMQHQTGAHPRIGACDVCPLIPIQNISIEETNTFALALSKRVGEKLNIPVYLYEYSSNTAHRKKLEQIRKGEYENFAEKITHPEWKPNFGPQTFNQKSGAVVIGARNFLIAYNINLTTSDVSIAKQIAERIRESGYTENGVQKKGFFKGLKAIGWYMNKFNCVQVSTNITDFRTAPIFDVFDKVMHLAHTFNCDVNGSELVGLIPKKALLNAGEIICPDVLDEIKILERVSAHLGLHSVKQFSIQEQILEYKAGI